MKQLDNIQSLRGIAALFVVLSHLLIIEQKYGGASTILPDIFRFGVFGVDIFFVISGFIMVTITKGKFQSLRETTRFFSHRITRIYPVYWFYSLLLLLVFLFRPEWVNSSQGNEIDILSSFLLYPSENLPLLAVGWTLIHEMYFYLVFAIIFLFIKEQRLIPVLLLWGTVIIVCNMFVDINSPLLKLVAHPLTFEFISGCLLALVYQNIILKVNFLILVLTTSSVLLIGIYFFSADIGAKGATPEGWSRPLILGIPALILVYLLLIAEKSNLVFSKFFVILGDASYSIYLTHILTLSVIGRLWYVFNSDSVLDNWVMLPIMLILSCVVGIVSYLWIEKPLIKISKRFIN